jgi:flagellar operon protein
MIDTVFFPNPIQTPASRPQSKTGQSGAGGKDTSFSRVLDDKLSSGGLTFSSHARERLESRGINLSSSDLDKLRGAVESVAKKGGRDSLVLMGDAALVVNVRNRTVVTALDREGMQGNVFTNIDSAVLVK